MQLSVRGMGEDRCGHPVPSENFKQMIVGFVFLFLKFFALVSFLLLRLLKKLSIYLLWHMLFKLMQYG